MIDFNLKKLAKTPHLPDKLTESVANDKHLTMLEVIKPYARDAALIEKNATPVYVDYKTRNSKVVFVLCPEWAPQFPPFNLARLSGICKSAGYESKIIDLNIKIYNIYRNDWQPNEKIPFRLWDPSGAWHWTSTEVYHDSIHPLLEPYLEEAVQEIMEYNADLIGFSIYYINEAPTRWMISRIKELNPSARIAVGGSNVQKGMFRRHDGYDYVVVGEGETAILKILDDIENKTEPEEFPALIVQPYNSKLSLNGMPLPDYESIDFSQYEIPNGVNTEFSRGCTAKCTFCEETHFWKYRQRKAIDILEEVEWLYYNKGTTVFWFIDSLVNGNVNELRAFCKAVEAKGLDIHWTGYSRCDGRMNLEYFKDLKAGGCIMLNYGCESGSQKVLDDMHKNVTIAEMEQNLIDGKKVGIYAATNWIVGFPTEEYQDFADSMTFLWRNRNYNINNVGAGVGLSQGQETIIGQNPKKFNIFDHQYQGHWITRDFRKGGVHVMHRVKSFHMFLDCINETMEQPFQYPYRINLAKEHYVVRYDDPSVIKEIDEYENFDYDIITPGINPFADGLVNEMWPFFRLLWQTRGGYTCEVLFKPEIDLKEFGSQFGPGTLEAVYKFRISAEGKWKADFMWDLKQPPNPYTFKPDAFIAQDYSRLMSHPAKRARKLAKPEWDAETGRDVDQFHRLIEDEKVLNNTIDFSFTYRYRGQGSW